MSFYSYRNDSLSCLVLNCLVVSVMIVLMSLTLHSPAPIVKYSSHQKLSLPSRPSLYQFIDEPTLKTLLNVSLFSFQEHVSQPTSPNKILPVLEVNGVTIAHLSNAKAVNYTHQSDPPNKEAVNKGIGGGHHLAEETSQVLENNELLAQHKPPYDIESLGSNRQLSQEHSVPGASSAAPNNRPYVVKKPLLHISSKRKLSSQNIISKDFLPQQPTQSVNWTKQTLDALKSRNTVVDDTDNQFSSKHDILPLVAFIDTRQRYNHKNSTAILVQVRDVKRIRYNRIIGCGIDNIKAKSFKAKPLFVYRNWIHSNVPNLTHSEAIVNCYDLPSVNGSKPYLLYRPFRAPGLLKIYSERPVMVTPGTMKPLSVVVCSTVYDQPPWLAHWLRYQETLGVDHIHLYAQQSFVDKGGLEEPEVKRLIMNGRLVVDLRSTHLTNSQVYFVSLGRWSYKCYSCNLHVVTATVTVGCSDPLNTHCKQTPTQLYKC